MEIKLEIDGEVILETQSRKVEYFYNNMPCIVQEEVGKCKGGYQMSEEANIRFVNGVCEGLMANKIFKVLFYRRWKQLNELIK